MRALFLPALVIAGLAVASPTEAAPKSRAVPKTKSGPARRVAKPARKAVKPAPKAAAPAYASLQISPAKVQLSGKGASQTLLVTGVLRGGQAVDLTRSATYRSGNSKVVAVGADGVLRSMGDGATTVVVSAGGVTARVPVQAKGSQLEDSLSFRNDVLPVLTRAGCSQAACHAKQGGKGGFQLSVLAYDPETDYYSVARQADSRRINRPEPGNSLLLLKATATVPHGGGQRFKTGSPEYRLLARWIAEGAREDSPQLPVVERVEIEPTERMLVPGKSQQMLATAVYSDGSRRDVTALAEYKSNEESVVQAHENGLLESSRLAGEAAVMVRYMGQVAVARVTVPLPANVARSEYDRLPRRNYIDDHVYRKLAQLNLLPSTPCDDATFLRRASLDLIGTLPTAAETRAFLAECDAEHQAGAANNAQGSGGAGSKGEGITGKTPPNPNLNPHPNRPLALKTRARLVENLLNRPEYADYWGMRWVNLLLVDRDPLFPKGAFAYDRWVRESFRQNKPFDQFAREIVIASGETYRDGPANFYRALASPEERAKSISQLFLGVRLDCAQCHHHPFERWGQDDFYSFTAFFARIRQKGSREFERIVYHAPDGESKHPKTGEVMPPRPLGAPAPEIAEGEDRREALASWMTAKENPYFARTIVNRMWGLMMGRGLVEPVDDFRSTNPASNETLLDAMAKDFVEHGYDLKHLLRTIVNSAAYQRSSEATPNNAKDTRNYSRFYVKRLPAEVLLDSVGQVTGVPEVFSGHPATTRAIQMWDNKLPVEFLEVFGKPSRLSVCECDRPTDGSVTQVLHLMNSPAVQNRLTAEKGVVTDLEKSGKPEEQIIEELYLSVYNRYPRPEEAQAAKAAFQGEGVTRRKAIEDLLWVLLNSPEFLFNH